MMLKKALLTGTDHYYKKDRPEGGNPREDKLVRKDKEKVMILKNFWKKKERIQAIEKGNGNLIERAKY